ncbi:hypothetical protein EHE22_09055 [Ochrobactrum pseudogrignonense]|uniref:Uncharacterized protein n=1 Tax=Brucella pseudogrignonensis TaxID=419475 RepID=A0A7Y3T3U4_9HYPH|nr:hypothetical protein [Brucella pseudogrignonensis]NNV20571.1 hypothetical protein [Brucella pseudogrignonensis]
MTKPLFDVFRSTMMNSAAGSRKEAQDAFIEQMKSDPEYVELLARDYFDRMAAVWTVRTETQASKVFTRTDVSQDKVERMSHPRGQVKPLELVRRTREETAARTATAFEEMKAKVRSIVLLDLVLPDGKALRDATGSECAKAGGFFSEVAKALKPTQVVDKNLTENDLQNIRARFYQANEAA